MFGSGIGIVCGFYFTVKENRSKLRSDAEFPL